MTALPSPFPAGVGFHQCEVSAEWLSGLLPGEHEALAEVRSEKRRQEFAAGRHAARAAIMAAGGTAGTAIPRGPGREPLWPDGFTGSITHKAGVAIAAAARLTLTAGLGLDLESLAIQVSPGIAKQLATAAETRWIEAASGEDGHAARLRSLFAAKESLFKALYPLEQVWFGYHDAELEWVEANGRFRATLLRRVAAGYAEGTTVDARCERNGEWILASVQLPA